MYVTVIRNIDRDTNKIPRVKSMPQISCVVTNVIKLPSKKWQTLRKMSCYWAEEYATSQYNAHSK